MLFCFMILSWAWKINWYPLLPLFIEWLFSVPSENMILLLNSLPMSRKTTKTPLSELRNAPEEILARSTTSGKSLLSTDQLLHELQVHQIELQMQNEELRQTQHLLEVERDQFVELYDFAPCGYLTLGDAGQINEINLTAAALLGEERLFLARRRFDSFIVNDDKDRWYRFVLNTMKNDIKQSCELSLQRRDGKQFFARLECIRLVKTGLSIQLRINIFDQTEVKRLQLQIDAPLRRYRTLMRNSKDGIHILDMHGNVVEANDAFCSMLGYTREEMVGLNAIAWAVDFSRDELHSRFKERIGKSVLIEARHRRKDGVLINVEISITGEVIDGQGWVFCSSRDITERKQTQIVMEQNIAELREAKGFVEESRTEIRGLAARNECVREEERRHIAREVHDELGQILTGLQMNISMLESTCGQGMTALHDQLKVTLELANNSLVVARSVASSLRPSSLDLGIVSAIEWLTERFSKNTGIICKIHFSEKDRDIALDENASIVLFRIAQESLTNIARHAHASKVDIKIGQHENSYYLTISDNGCGFDSDTVKAGAFGLVGIRERVLSLGGELSIRGKSGKGTEIEVRIIRDNQQETL